MPNALRQHVRPVAFDVDLLSHGVSGDGRGIHCFVEESDQSIAFSERRDGVGGALYEHDFRDRSGMGS